MKNEPQRKPQCFMLPRRRNIHTAVNTNSHVPFVLSCLHHRIHLKRLLSLLCTLINHNSYIIWETQQPHGFPRGKEKDVSVNMCLVHKGGESWNHIENDSNDSEELLCIAWHFPSPLAAPQSVPATTQHLWMLMHTRTHTHTINSVYWQRTISVRGIPKVPSVMSLSALEIIFSAFILLPPVKFNLSRLIF